ncbi:STAS domain-containing protein [Chloroflexia bacterium SDU3-3]|nr:STAS domain-containing protein [Chloroflexia bacterium SDU3-3]
MEHFFLSIRSSNNETVIRGRLLKGGAIIVALTVIIVALVVISRPQRQSIGILTPIFLLEIAICALTFAMAHYGAVNPGGFLLCITLIVANVVISWVLRQVNPLYGLTSDVHLFPILISGMVIGSSAVPIFGLMPVFALLLLYVMGENIQTQISPTIIITMAAGMFWLIVRTLERSLHDARAKTAEAQTAQRNLEQQQQALLEANQSLSSNNEQINKLFSLVNDLETPLIPVLDGVLVLPLVGHIDAQRTSRISSMVLHQMYSQRAHTLIVDLTGVTMVDGAVVEWIDQLGHGIRLIGARTLVTGMRAEMAYTMAMEDVGTEGIRAVGRLQDGIRMVLRGA